MGSLRLEGRGWGCSRIYGSRSNTANVKNIIDPINRFYSFSFSLLSTLRV